MIVLKKEPGKDPVLTDIDNTLEAFQKNVEGYIETVTLTEELVIVCNEEGRIQSLPYNCTVMNADFCGKILIAGIDGDEFTDVPTTTAKFFSKLVQVKDNE